MAKKISVPAMRVKQNISGIKDLFLASIKVRDLIDPSQFQIDQWDPSKGISDNQGYQRKPGLSRISKIGRFATERNDAIFPTTVLVCARPKPGEQAIKFEENSNGGILTIQHYPLWVVDGQHRIEGLRYAIEDLDGDRWLDFEMPVVFLNNFDRLEEVRQFFFLNTYQKRVSTDLAERLLADLAYNSKEELERQISTNIDWGNRALKVIDMLNSKEESPWYRKIRVPNTEKLPSHIVSQVSFKKSLQPAFRDGLLSLIKNADTAYDIVANYWKSIKSIFPEAFSDPKEYVIQKTPGVFSLNQLGHKIFLHLGRDRTSVNDYKQVLEKVFPTDGDIVSDWWRGDNSEGAGLYGSMKGFAIMARQFEDELERNTK